MKIEIASWHFTSLLDLADHWQGLLAGALGFGAAILAVTFTLNAERRKQNFELIALRRSFGVEFRQSLLAAFGAHQSLARLAQSAGPISPTMMESLVILPQPVIYPASADKIGLLGPEAMDVVQMYGLLWAVGDSVSRLQKRTAPVANILVASTADALITVCTQGAAVLPRLKTEVAHIDTKDADLVRMISVQAATWAGVRTRWPELNQTSP